VIVEVGLFRIPPDRTGAFEPVADDIRRAFAAGGIGGLHSFHLAEAMEDPARFTVLVAWDSVVDHRAFVASAEGARQRDLLAGFMVEGQTEVFHVDLPDVERGLV
jgi:heme-degrading monooxygenase HmoA